MNTRSAAIAFAVGVLLVTTPASADTRPREKERPEIPKSSDAKYALIIYITSEGRLLVGGVSVKPEDITRMLKASKDGYEKPMILLRAHRKAKVSAIKQATKAAQAAGVSRVVFASWRAVPPTKIP